jgi:polyhydroxybutyrate depolymerase
MRKSARLLSMLAVGWLCLAACGGSTLQAQSARSPLTSPSLIPSGMSSITVDGVLRTYIMFRPASLDPSQPAPLVLALHGWTSAAALLEARSHFDDLATTAGFEVVYPQGVNNAWNAGWCCGGAQTDDVAFIEALIDKLVAGGGVDRKRVFVTGMSNGAMMAQRLACEATGRFAAVASVAGALVIGACTPSRPISVLEMHGTADTAIAYEGGGLANFMPTMSNLQRWASLNGCSSTAANAKSGITTTYTWSGCQGGSKVVLMAITGAGHNWFNAASDGLPGEPDASQTVWDFFTHAPSAP